MSTIKLVYYKGGFYMKSGTTMSCLYTEDKQRCDWGIVERTLENGDTITIRPANHAEMTWAKKKLEECQK